MVKPVTWEMVSSFIKEAHYNGGGFEKKNGADERFVSWVNYDDITQFIGWAKQKANLSELETFRLPSTRETFDVLRLGGQFPLEYEWGMVDYDNRWLIKIWKPLPECEIKALNHSEEERRIECSFRLSFVTARPLETIISLFPGP